jgi:hypothetical protein
VTRKGQTSTGVGRQAKNASRMPPDQRSDMGTTASTTRKSTETPLQPLHSTETDLASGYIPMGYCARCKDSRLGDPDVVDPPSPGRAKRQLQERGEGMVSSSFYPKKLANTLAGSWR